MKFLHSSDWHLGRDFANYDLGEYQDGFLDQILTQIEKHRPDALLITGDVLDKSNPGDADLEKLSGFLNRARLLTRVILIAGNHDGASRLGFARGFTLPEVTIVTQAAQVGTAVEVPGADGELGALVYPIPYLYPYQDRVELSSWVDAEGQRHLDDALMDAIVPGEADRLPTLPGKPDALFAAALRRIGRDLERRQADVPVVILAHDYLTEVKPDTEPEPLGNLYPIPSSLLDDLGGALPEGPGVDYLALGHIHGAFPVKGTKVTAWYAGSPLPYRVSEKNQKYSLLIEIDPAHCVSVDRLPLDLPYKVAQLEGSIAELTDPDDPRYKPFHQAYCNITLTESTPPPNAYNRLKAVFPKMLKFSTTKSLAGIGGHLGGDSSELSVLEVTKEFLKAVGTDDPELVKALEEMIAEIDATGVSQ